MKNKNIYTNNVVWQFFASIKLAVVILFFLAATSIIGTFIPQNASSAFYYQKYGEIIYKIFSILNIFDMYHAWWFLMLLGLLIINLIVCSINRLNFVWKIIFPENIVFNVERFRKIKEKYKFVSKKNINELKGQYKTFLEKKFKKVIIKNTENGVAFFIETKRWTRLGAYIVHFSILLLLFGVIIGSLFGFKGFVQIPEGKTIDTVKIRKNSKIQKLGFKVKCNKFDVSFYDNGSPAEYKSNITIFENKKQILIKDIIVNDPLKYKGITFYQSSYGTTSIKQVSIAIINPRTKKTYIKQISQGQEIILPEKRGKFVFYKFVNSYNFHGHNLGETFIGKYIDNNEKAFKIIIPLKFPLFDKMRKGHFIFKIKELEKKYYTGLQVTKDPGVWYVYAGFIFMIIGCWITFFLSHQSFCIEILEKEKNNNVLVSGISHRKTQNMKIKITKLGQKLMDM
ncbi:MAG: cytochrome C biogenesis protein ResB [Desulfobacteraceae bacterium 4572_130]|nr:MAG: cytochrome C biogenesis protein ResB [Desulfobacteraceae bacterium 4572_130]